MKFIKKLIKFTLLMFTLSVLSYSQPTPPSILTPQNFSQDVWVGLTRFTWTQSSGATSYTIEISDDNLFSSIAHTATVNNALYDYSGLTPVHSYYWRVKASGPGGTSGWSDVGAFFTSNTIPPNAPDLLIPGNEALNVAISPTTFSWSSIDGVTAWQIQIARDNAFTNIIHDAISGANVYNFSNLNNNTKYYWRVMAGGGSNWSVVRSFTTEAPAIILPPELVSPLNGINNIGINPTVLNWNPSTGATSYNIQIAIDINFNYIHVNLNSSVPTLSVNGLSNYMKYYWRVKATNGVLTSQWSGIWSFNTITNLPTIPDLTTPSENEIDVPINPTFFLWSNAGVYSSFNIQIAKDTGFTEIIKSSKVEAAMTFSTNGLLPGTKYYWRVNSVNAAGISEWSKFKSFSTVPPVPPAPLLMGPLDNALNLSAKNIIFNWYPSEGASSYKIQISPDSTFADDISEGEAIQPYFLGAMFPSVKNNQRIFWRVRAVNIGGNGEWSTVRNFKTNTALPELIIPADSSVDIRIDSTRFTWKSVEGAISYKLQIYLDSLLSYPSFEVILSDTSRIVTLWKGVTCFWRVQSIGPDGEGEFSQVWRLKTLPFPPEKASLIYPALKQLGIPINPTTFKWKLIPGASRYKFQLSDVSGFTTIKADTIISADSINIYNLDYNINYYWRIAGINNGGTGVWSDTWNFLSGLPTPISFYPSSDTINIDESSIFNWSALPYCMYAIQFTLDTNLTKSAVDGLLVVNMQFSTYNDRGVNDMFPNPTAGLKLYRNKTYYWRGRYFRYLNNNTSGFSSWKRFTTALDNPTEISPIDNSYLHKVTSVKLSWNKVAGITDYRIQISTSRDFSPIIKDITTSNTEITIDSLKINYRYYWRIQSRKLPQYSSWSPTATFMNGNETMIPPVPITPLNETNYNPARSTIVEFKWKETPYSWKYVLQVSSDTSFKNLTYQDTIYSYTFHRLGFGFDKTYFWRIKAMNRDSSTIWSGSNEFSTISAPPGKPILRSPVYMPYGTYDVHPGITFTWDAVPGTKRYWLQVRTSTYSTRQGWDDGYVYINNSNLTGTSYTATDLSPHATYNWRVAAINNAGQSEWSDEWLFYTIKSTPYPPIPISPANNANLGRAWWVNFSWKVRAFATSNLQVYFRTFSGYYSCLKEQVSGTGATFSSMNFPFGNLLYWNLTSAFTSNSAKFFMNPHNNNYYDLGFYSLNSKQRYYNKTINSVEENGFRNILSITLKPESGNYETIFGTEKGVFGWNNSVLNRIGNNGDSLTHVSSAIGNKQGDLFVSANRGIWRFKQNESRWNLIHPYEGEAQLLTDSSLSEMRAVIGNFFIRSRNNGDDWDLIKDFSKYSDSLSYIKIYETENLKYFTVSKISEQSAGRNPEIYTWKDTICQSLNFNGKDGVTAISSLIIPIDKSILIGTEKGIYKYTGSWNSGSLSGGIITSIQKLSNGNILASCLGKPFSKYDDPAPAPEPGIYRSTDNGLTWSLLTEGIYDSRVTCFGYKQTGELIIGTENGKIFGTKYELNNTAPIFTSPVIDTIVSVGQKLSLLFSANDDNHDKLTFYNANAPDNAAFTTLSNDSYLMEWTPTKAGVYNEIKIMVYDGSFLTTQILKINVVSNRAPVINIEKDNYELAETKTLSFDFKYSDSDNDLLTLKVSGSCLNLGLKVDSISSDTRRISWTPQIGQKGAYNLNIIVSDGKTSIGRDIKILVNRLNRPPAKFALLQPQENSTIDLFYPAKPLIFKWKRSADPDSSDIISYNLKINGQSLSIDTAININQGDTILFVMDIMSKLKISETYEWYVTASDGDTTVQSETKIKFKTSNKFNRIERENITPANFELGQNYPNPFNSSTTISYSLPVKGYVKLIIYNVLGKEIVTLISENQEAGIYRVQWNTTNIPSGIFYYILLAESERKTFKDIKKMILLK